VYLWPRFWHIQPNNTKIILFFVKVQVRSTRKGDRDTMMANREEGLPTETLDTLRELGLSLTNHSRWTRRLHRTLLCDAKPEESDLKEDAHHRCLFGQWYYSTHNPRLTELEDFHQIEELHKQVHDSARELLNFKQTGKCISLESYDRFTDAINVFRAAIQDLQYAIISEVCTIDHLTGVWNRYTMSYKLIQEVERSRRNGSPSAIALLDFDHFKMINDRYGHPVGDQVLKDAVGFITSRLRKYDAMFRYGGEEFLILFPDTSVDDATSIVDRLREDITKRPMASHNGKDIHVTISSGIAALDHQIPHAESIEHADKALLIAKNNGRNCVVTMPS
jgi:diguanylate cyclase (GGDEF)-like protein